MTDLETTIEYYKDLLLFQYADKPKARATIGVLVETALCDLLPMEMGKAFDLETAIGDQLDILGKYIGFSRRIVGEIPRTWFEVVDYVTYNPATVYPGFTDYSNLDTNSDTQFYRYIYLSNSFSDLTDDEYRYMLKLKLALNSSNNTLYEIQNILFDFFGYDIIAYDLKNMTISYSVLASTSYFALLAISQGLLPKPMGVGLAGVFEVVDQTKLFGFQDYVFNASNETGFSDYLTGFNGYQWISYLNKIA
jgi:hypothetical protein